MYVSATLYLYRRGNIHIMKLVISIVYHYVHYSKSLESANRIGLTKNWSSLCSK